MCFAYRLITNNWIKKIPKLLDFLRVLRRGASLRNYELKQKQRLYRKQLLSQQKLISVS